MTGQRIRVSHNDHTAPANVESPRLQLIVKFTSFLSSEFVKQVCLFPVADGALLMGGHVTYHFF